MWVGEAQVSFKVSPKRVIFKLFFFFFFYIFKLFLKRGFKKIEGTYSGKWASQVALVVKNPPANAGDISKMGSIPGLGRSPGGGNGNPPQYSCLEKPMGRGAWWATVHGITKSQTQLK